jgi:hypothetical protein
MCQHNRQKAKCCEPPCQGKGFCVHKKHRSLCFLCKGSQICQHSKRKGSCLICKGSQICIHSKQKSDCIECLKSTPLEKILKRKNRCLCCGRRLKSLVRQQEQLCKPCSREYNNSGPSVRIEHVWRDIMIEEMQFPPTSMDQGLCPVEGLCQSKYRPDMLYLTTNIAILLELDEDSHKRYSIDCEVARLCGLKEYFPDHIVLVIRLNPDNSNQTTLLLNDRTRVMVCVAEFYLRYPERLCLLRTNVSYLYYSGVKHIDEAITNKDSIDVLPLISCAHPSSNRKFLV